MHSEAIVMTKVLTKAIWELITDLIRRISSQVVREIFMIYMLHVLHLVKMFSLLAMQIKFGDTCQSVLTYDITQTYSRYSCDCYNFGQQCIVFLILNQILLMLLLKVNPIKSVIIFFLSFIQRRLSIHITSTRRYCSLNILKL